MKWLKIYHEPVKHKFSIHKKQKIIGNGIDHWHQRTELVYVLSGECDIKIGKTTYTFYSGDLAVVHSGEIHSIFIAEECEMYICLFNPSILYNFQAEMKFIKGYIPAAELKQAGIDREVLQLFEEIDREKTDSGVWHESIIQSDIIRLYSILVRHFEQKAHAGGKNSSKFQYFQEALSYITENYSENIALKDIAQKINYNPTYVSTLFVTYTGVNFKTYLDSFRINLAVELIKNTDQTIADIASQCGYENVRTFNNTFKRITNLSPSQLRNKSV